MEAFIISVIVCFILYYLADWLNWGDGCLVALGGVIRLFCIGVPIYFFVQWITESDNEKVKHKYEYVIDPNYSNDEAEESVENEESSSDSYNDGPVYTEPSGGYYSTPTYQQEERTPASYPCRACRQTGTCSVCNGSGRTIVGVNYYSSPYEPIEGDCKTCGGSGRCHSCGGDGFLNEGIDF